MAASDVFLFATPVYWYGPTTLMKTMLDRLVVFNQPQGGCGPRPPSRSPSTNLEVYRKLAPAFDAMRKNEADLGELLHRIEN